MHLLSSKLYCFLLVGKCSCLCVATVYVRLFIVSLRTIKEERQVCFLLSIHNVQVLINNNEKKQQQKKRINEIGKLPRMFTTKTRIRLYRRTI